MRTQESLAELVLSTKTLIARYLKGFDEGNARAQAPGLPNHAVWNLGHLALTMHRACELLDNAATPETEFFSKGTLRGDAQRYGPESVAFGSEPTGDASMYPGLARGVEIVNNACDRLAARVRRATDEELAKQIPWGPAGQTLSWHLLVGRMVFHNGFHTGQLADMRRALGLGSIFA